MKERKASDPFAGLSIYVPRPVRLSGTGRAVVAIAMALAAAGSVLPSLLWAYRERKAELRERLDREGVVVRAVVTRTGKTSGDNPRHFAVYRYAGGMGRVELRRGEEPLAPGDEIPVRYLAGQPSRSWAIGHGPSGPPRAVIPVVASSFWLGASLIALGVRRQWRLLAEGRAAAGRVVAIKSTKSEGDSQHQAEYEITLLSGAVRRIWTGAGKQTAVGSVVPVIYDPENPRRVSTYPLSLVRVARD